MSTLRLTLLLPLIAACSTTPLGSGADLGAPDQASADLTRADQSSPDQAPADLVSSAADQGTGADGGSPQVGVPCGTSLCNTSGGLACCEISQTCVAPPCMPGEQTDACDGPEDCPTGSVCCLYVDPFFGTACSPSCSQMGGQRGRICHTAADCEPGQMCVQLEAGGGIYGCI
jgi:hypothetical protein